MSSFILSTWISTFISTAIAVWSIVSMWIIFKKAGRKGWEAIIPVWNIYVLFKIAGKKGWFWVLLLVPILWIIVSLVFRFIMDSVDTNGYYSIYRIKNMINWILGLLSLIISIITWISLPYGLTKKFGRSNRFFVGMLFFTPIFFGILAFSDVKYEGIEFNEKYSWKKWLFITLGIALIVGCSQTGLEYKQYKNFSSEYEYETGKKDREFKGTTLNGNEWGGRYEGGKKVGHWVEYDYETKWEGEYNNDGKRDGEWKITTEDGKEGGGKYENGKEIGEWIRYSGLGRKFEGTYNVEGLEEGEWKTYNDNGNLFIVGNYKNGEQVGEWIYYRDDGTSTKLIFKDGKPWEGTMLYAGDERNYENGKILYDGGWVPPKPPKSDH